MSRTTSSNRFVEQLENRRLFATAHVVSIVSDNRGEVVVTFDKALSRPTINGRSVQVHTPGPDDKFGTADDVKLSGRVRLTTGDRRITFKTDVLPTNTIYSFKVNSKRALDAEGQRIDGEFNGAGSATGNDLAGGDLLFISKRDIGNFPVARMQTSLGAIEVTLNKSATPHTVGNFLNYANTGAWDGTIFHRASDLPSPYNRDFVIQGGGFKVNASNLLDFVTQNAAVVNEPGISNTRGTIAMAKLGGDPNSATNQFFFNVQDNSGDPAQLDTQNGGFTVFGSISSGLSVMDAIAGLPLKDLRTSGNATPGSDPTAAMDDAPVINTSVGPGNIPNPGADLVVIRRVAIRNKISTFVIG